jgi:hypothetical protein
VSLRALRTKDRVKRLIRRPFEVCEGSQIQTIKMAAGGSARIVFRLRADARRRASARKLHPPFEERETSRENWRPSATSRGLGFRACRGSDLSFAPDRGQSNEPLSRLSGVDKKPSPCAARRARDANDNGYYRAPS